jgi:hypothetical protein
MSLASALVSAFRIDLSTQTTFPLSDLRKHVPPRRGGKPLNIATGFRWAKDGARAADGTRVRLPIIQIGGTKCTSLEALQWFCDQLTGGGGTAPIASRTSAARRREIEKANLDCEQRGA